MAKSQPPPPSPGPKQIELLVICKSGFTVLREPFFLSCVVLVYVYLVFIIFQWFGLFGDFAI